MERISSFDKLVMRGYSGTQKLEDFRIELGRTRMADGGLPMDNELKKTPAQLEICRLMNVLTNTLLERHGLKPLDVPPENMHIFGNNLSLDGSEIGGIFLPPDQLTIVREGRSLIEFADFVAHELIHFKSFGAVQVPSGADDLDFEYRSGFSAHSRDGKRSFFHAIDEALTEQLSKGLVESLKTSGNSLLADEVEEMQRVLAEYGQNPEFATDVMTARYLEDGHPMKGRYNVMATHYIYQEERAILNSLIDKIFSKNSGRFTTKEEVFDLFAKGKLQGNFLGIGKVIERTFGKGTFRKLGEVSNLKDTAEYKTFVERL